MPRTSSRLDQFEQFAVDVILERRWDFWAWVFRLFLRLLSLIYRVVVRWRLWIFETRLASVHALGCLVVSVGNLTVGGTGKTPVVELFARELTKRGRKVAVLSRGYKSAPAPLQQRLFDRFQPMELRHPPRVVSDGRSLLLDSDMAGDEPFMLASNLKDVHVIVDKDRVKAGLHAIRKFGCDTLVLDDGLQYLRLKERIDVVLIDSESPFANRYLLPRGLLREPPQQLRRAHIIFLTKCDGRDLGELREELRRYNKHADIVECAHKPLHLEEVFTNEIVPLSFLKDLRVGMLCGIARPESFEVGPEEAGRGGDLFAAVRGPSPLQRGRNREDVRAEQGAQCARGDHDGEGFGAFSAHGEAAAAGLFPARGDRDHSRARRVRAVPGADVQL